MSRATARDLIFQYVLPFIDGELENAIAASPGTIRGIDNVISGIGTVPQTIRQSLNNAMALRRATQANMAADLSPVLDAAIAYYMQEIGSSQVTGGSLVSRSGACFDLRASLIANNEYVAAIGNTIAANPSTTALPEGSDIILRRLTVDHTGQNIEGGRRETVTYEVTQTAITGAGLRVVKGVLYGDDGPDDYLDRDGGTSRDIDISMDAFNEITRGGIQNSTFALSGAPSNGDAIPLDQTVLGSPWVQTTPTSTATCVARTTNLWRSKSNGIALSGQNTDRRFTQPLVVPAAGQGTPNAYTPVDWLTVVYYDGTWTGTITVAWGNKSQAFTNAAFTGAGFKYLVPDLDKDLYPVNFTTTSPTFYVNVATTSATGEIVLHYADLQRMVPRQGFFYSVWSHTNDPAEGFTKTWADSCAFTGKLARAFSKVYGEEAFAYLPTLGLSVINPPTLAPEIGITRNGSNVADGGTIALGSVASGAHAVTVRIANTGTAPLAIGIPTSGTDTNISSVTFSLTAPGVVDANTDDYLDLVITVTDGGAGAFSTLVTIGNNDASEGTYEITISGTAT